MKGRHIRGMPDFVIASSKGFYNRNCEDFGHCGSEEGAHCPDLITCSICGKRLCNYVKSAVYPGQGEDLCPQCRMEAGGIYLYGSIEDGVACLTERDYEAWKKEVEKEW